MHAVAVGAAARVAAGVEALGRLLALQHAHVVGQVRVESRGRGGGARVAGHLPPSVHTRIGAPRHGQRYRLGQHAGKGLLEHPLHGAQARLGGPAVEAGPVVGEQQASGQG